MNQATSQDCIVREGRSGWLARSAERGVGIGVVGATREEAEQRFRVAMDRHVRLLEDGSHDQAEAETN